MNEREKQITKVTLVGSVVNLLLAAFKIIAGIFGRSGAMVADGVHSLSDLVSDVVVLVFIPMSSKGRDKRHKYGHGKFETLATLIVSIILIVVSAKLIIESIN
ncbi:MAG: cation diffusion facilitator family transporter, partial [Bacteroidales bacterium]|nr:cation diffusion facilitator family transporter [Bacteroidales bacterium]